MVISPQGQVLPLVDPRNAYLNHQSCVTPERKHGSGASGWKGSLSLLDGRSGGRGGCGPVSPEVLLE